MLKVWLSWLPLIVSVITTEVSNITDICLFNKNCDSCDAKCQQDNLDFELMIITNFNPSVDSCDDFYEYACSDFDNFLENDPHTNFFAPLTNELNQLKQLVETSNSSNTFKPFNFIKNYMTSCVNLNSNNRQSNSSVKKDKLDSLKRIISEFGGWPVVVGPQWNETNFDVYEFTIKAQDIGCNSPGVYWPYIELSMRNMWSLQIEPPAMNFPSMNSMDPSYQSTINNLHEYMVDVAKFLGANESLAREELMLSLEFERQLYNVSRENNSPPLNGTSNNNGISVKAAIEKWPSINWLKLLKKYHFNNESVVFITNPHYITKLEELIKETPKRIQANYVVWNAIDYLIPQVESATLYNISEKYDNFVGYTLGEQECFDTLLQSLPELLIAYWERHFRTEEEVKSRAYELALDVKHHLINTVNNASWLDDEAKNDIIKHLTSLDFIFGATDAMFDDKKLGEYFQGLEITPDDYLMNFLRVSSFNNEKFLNEVLKSEELRNLEVIFKLRNIFHTDGSNELFFGRIVLDYGVMKHLYFNINRPYYVNYGTLGTLIAHELGHAVDHRYKNLNSYGVNENNWSPSSNQKYKNVENCLIEQFNNYTYGTTKHKVNGLVTLNENIADNIGLKIAYSAYQDWIKKHGSEPTYSNSLFNANQLFWLSYANKFCHDKSPFDASVLEYTHSPSDKRVIGSFSNSPDFAKDFNCPEGSKMNPVKKCNFF